MANFFDLIGRIMISAIFLFSGVNKIFNYDGTVGWMEGFGIPGILLIPAIIIEILFPKLLLDIIENQEVQILPSNSLIHQN